MYVSPGRTRSGAERFAIAIPDGASMCVLVLSSVSCTVRVDVGVAVCVGADGVLRVGDAVCVGVGVGVCAGVGVGVAVCVGVGVGVAVCVGVGVGVAVGVGVDVAFGASVRAGVVFCDVPTDWVGESLTCSADTVGPIVDRKSSLSCVAATLAVASGLSIIKAPTSRAKETTAGGYSVLGSIC